MAATLYTSKYLCLNILSTDVKDGQIHLSIMKILIGLLNTKMKGNYRKDSRSLFQMDQNCFLNQSYTKQTPKYTGSTRKIGIQFQETKEGKIS